MAFANAQLEQDYLLARYSQYRRLALNLGLVTALVPLGLWLRDFVSLHDVAWGALNARLLMVAGVLTYVVALAFEAPRRLTILAAYFGVLVAVAAASASWGRLPVHDDLAYTDYLYLFLLAPPLLLPLSIREVFGVLVVVCMVPNAQTLLGIEPAFSVPMFNLVMWPASALAVFSLLEYDKVSRRLFLAQRRMRTQALRDPLTGIGNRRDFEDRAQAAFAAARRGVNQLAVLMIDVDSFKAINDRHGHAAGNEVLRALARTMESSLRESDISARLGGEEFGAVLPEQGLEAGAVVAERLRAAFAWLRIDAGSVHGRVEATLCIGVAAYPRDGDSLEALLRCADQRLYAAKQAGRNKVVASG